MGFDLQALIPIILAVLFIVLGGARRRKPAQSDPPPQPNPDVNVPPDSEVVLPPFMQNFEGFTEESEFSEEVVNSSDEEVAVVSEQIEPEAVQEPVSERKPAVPPPVPTDSPTPLITRPLPGTSLIEISPETFRQGIILAEILGKPKTLRPRR